MKTGIELMAAERAEHLGKHNISVEYDYNNNADGSLVEAASNLLDADKFMDIEKEMLCPEDWSEELWMKMVSKPYKERLIIAGSLIAAEIDRLQYEKQ